MRSCVTEVDKDARPVLAFLDVTFNAPEVRSFLMTGQYLAHVITPPPKRPSI